MSGGKTTMEKTQIPALAFRDIKHRDIREIETKWSLATTV